MSRVVAGLLVSPLIAAGTATAFAFAVRPLNRVLFPWGDWHESSGYTATFFAVALLFAAASTLILAIPAVACVRDRFAITLRAAGLIGALIGALPFLLMAALAVFFAFADHVVAEVPGRILADLPYFVAGVLSGLVAGLCFWRVAIKENAYFQRA
jgi:hypothetical protein